MKILVLADNFVPEIAATSFRVRDHARYWIQQGHEVTVVTCVPNWPHGKVFPGYENRLYQEEWIDGIRVIRLWSYMAANKGFLARSLDYVSYLISATVLCGRYPDFDVVLATSPQFFTAVAGWSVATLRRRPWVFEVRDLWPATIQAVGMSRGVVLRMLEQLELWLYRRARRVIALTDSFKRNLVGRGIDAAKIDVVTNGVDLESFGFDPAKVDRDARRRLGIPSEAFLAGYIGTTGMCHHLETLVDAAALCRQRHDVRFLIMGEGAEREALEARALRHGLTNLHFADRVPHEQVPDYVAALDLAIIHLRPDPLFRSVIPSKLFEFMAMGVPVLLAVEGESARVVSQAGCGICIAPGDPEAIATAVKNLATDRAALDGMGRRGRQVVAEKYSRPVKADAALCSLEMAAGRKRQKGYVDELRISRSVPNRKAA